MNANLRGYLEGKLARIISFRVKLPKNPLLPFRTVCGIFFLQADVLKGFSGLTQNGTWMNSHP